MTILTVLEKEDKKISGEGFKKVINEIIHEKFFTTKDEVGYKRIEFTKYLKTGFTMHLVKKDTERLIKEGFLNKDGTLKTNGYN